MAIARMNQEETDRENRETCRRIAEVLDKIAAGELYYCSKCGNIVNLEFNEEGIAECPDCGTEIQEDDAEQACMYHYFESDDIYDIEYRISASGDLRSVRYMIACGGPNIYIDTGTGSVNLFWWSDRAEYPLSREAIQQIDEMAEDLYNCNR